MSTEDSGLTHLVVTRYTDHRCNSCAQMAKVFAEVLGNTYFGKGIEVKLVDVKSEENCSSPVNGIKELPTVIFHDAVGNELSRCAGIKTADVFANIIQTNYDVARSRGEQVVA